MSGDPGPRRARSGGVYVIMITGLLALLGFGAVAHSATDIALLVLIGIVTLGGGLLMRRFIATHGDQIGEARFDTRDRSEPDER